MNLGDTRNIIQSYNLRNLAQSSPYILDLISDDPNYYLIRDLNYYYNGIIKTMVLEKQDYKCAICETETAEYLFEKWKPAQETNDHTRLVLENVIGVCSRCMRELDKKTLKNETSKPIWVSPFPDNHVFRAENDVNFDLAYLSNFDEELRRIANMILNQLYSLKTKGVLLDKRGQLVLKASVNTQCNLRKIIGTGTVELLNVFKKHTNDTRVKLNQEALLKVILLIKEKFIEMTLQELKRKCLDEVCDPDTQEMGLRLQSCMNQVRAMRLFATSSAKARSFIDKIRELETEMHVESCIKRIFELYPNKLVNKESKLLCSAYWYFYSPSDSVFKIIKKMYEENPKRKFTIIISNKKQKQQIVKVEINNIFSPDEIRESVKALGYFEIIGEPRLYSKVNIGAKKPILSLSKK